MFSTSEHECVQMLWRLNEQIDERASVSLLSSSASDSMKTDTKEIPLFRELSEHNWSSYYKLMVLGPDFKLQK